MKKTKYALVLSGGAFLGAFELGVINYLNEKWQQITGSSQPMKFDLIAGISVGSINGAMLAMNQLGKLNDLWVNAIGKNGVSEIYTSDFIDTAYQGDDLKLKVDIESIAKKLIPDYQLKLNVFKKLGMVFSKKKRRKILKEIAVDIENHIKAGMNHFRALADNTPLKQKLHRYLDRSQINNTDFICGFVSLDTGEYHSVMHREFSTNEDFIKGVLSSTSMPIVWEPVDRVNYVKGKQFLPTKNLVDGGVKNVSPMGDVVRYIQNDPEDCEYKVIIVNCHSGTNRYEDYTHKNVGEIAMRAMYEIAFTEIFNNDVKQFLRINDLVRQAYTKKDVVLYDEQGRELNAFDAVVIQPHPEMDLGNSLVANQRLIELRMEHGKQMAELVFSGKNLKS